MTGFAERSAVFDIPEGITRYGAINGIDREIIHNFREGDDVIRFYSSPTNAALSTCEIISSENSAAPNLVLPQSPDLESKSEAAAFPVGVSLAPDGRFKDGPANSPCLSFGPRRLAASFFNLIGAKFRFHPTQGVSGGARSWRNVFSLENIQNRFSSHGEFSRDLIRGQSSKVGGDDLLRVFCGAIPLYVPIAQTGNPHIGGLLFRFQRRAIKGRCGGSNAATPRQYTPSSPLAQEKPSGFAGTAIPPRHECRGFSRRIR